MGDKKALVRLIYETIEALKRIASRFLGKRLNSTGASDDSLQDTSRFVYFSNVMLARNFLAFDHNGLFQLSVEHFVLLG